MQRLDIAALAPESCLDVDKIPIFHVSLMAEFTCSNALSSSRPFASRSSQNSHAVFNERNIQARNENDLFEHDYNS